MKAENKKVATQKRRKNEKRNQDHKTGAGDDLIREPSRNRTLTHLNFSQGKGDEGKKAPSTRTLSKVGTEKL